MTIENTNVSRRTLVKGAAWSLPVIAVAAATPMAAASTATWNGTVTGFCAGDYDLSALQDIVGAGLVGTVQTALGVIGLEPGARRGFTIQATTGNIPAGTQYLLQDPNALLTIGGLESILSASAIGVVSTADGWMLTLSNAIPQGQTVTIDLYRALIDAGALSSFTLSQVQADSNAGDNSGAVSSIAAASVDLGTLGIPFVSGDLTVQLCG